LNPAAENEEDISQMRKLNVCAFSLMTAGLMTVAVVSPAAAADKKTIDVSGTARMISTHSPVGAVMPNTSYSGLAATNVSVGPETTGVPCGECVPTADGNNIGLPWPLFAVETGSTLSISTWFESTSYTGACTAGIILTQGTTTVATGEYAFPGGCNAGYLYGVFFTVPAPATTGFTSVVGTINGGGINKSGADTFINVQ
jgi:hypothetical protein